MADVPALTTGALSLSNILLVTPQAKIGYQPELTPRPTSLVFHYEGEQTATLESDITDHFVEDNTAIQDQIALKPEVLTTHGFIGELNDIAPNAFLAGAREIATRLTTIAAYTPALSVTALRAYAQADYAYRVAEAAANTAISAWANITGENSNSLIDGIGIVKRPNQGKQQIMFQQLYGYWRTRVLFTVQTPWAVFQHMAIKSLRAIQDADTRMITDFEITFKMIRFASTITEEKQPDDVAGRLKSYVGQATNLGTAALSPSAVPLSDVIAQSSGVA